MPSCGCVVDDFLDCLSRWLHGLPLPETSCCCWLNYSLLRPELRCDHLLNLSISVSRGKETNKDSRSNGE
jgi:hypothetical protein